MEHEKRNSVKKPAFISLLQNSPSSLCVNIYKNTFSPLKLLNKGNGYYNFSFPLTTPLRDLLYSP